MPMSVADLIKLLGGYNKNYTVQLINTHGFPEVVIIDFNGRILKVIPL